VDIKHTAHGWLIKETEWFMLMSLSGVEGTCEETEQMMLNQVKGGPYLCLEDKRGYHCCNQKELLVCSNTGIRSYVYGMRDDIGPMRSVQRIPKLMGTSTRKIEISAQLNVIEQNPTGYTIRE
jgi:hypothetical protein